MNGISTYDMYGPGGKPKSAQQLKAQADAQYKWQEESKRWQEMNNFRDEIIKKANKTTKILYELPFYIIWSIIIVGIILLIIYGKQSNKNTNLLISGLSMFIPGLILAFFGINNFFSRIILRKESIKQNRLDEYKKLFE